MSRLAYVRDVLGFDKSKAIPFSSGITLRCSQCEALAICGVPTHEAGCPHMTRECEGCNNRIPARSWAKYCEDCQ